MDENTVKNSDSEKQLFLFLNILSIVFTTLLMLLIIWGVEWTGLIIFYAILFIFILNRNKLDWTKNPILTIKKAKLLNYISAVFIFWTFLFDSLFEINRDFIYLGLIAITIGIRAVYIATNTKDKIYKVDIIDDIEIHDTPVHEQEKTIN